MGLGKFCCVKVAAGTWFCRQHAGIVPPAAVAQSDAQNAQHFSRLRLYDWSG